MVFILIFESKYFYIALSFLLLFLVGLAAFYWTLGTYDWEFSGSELYIKVDQRVYEIGDTLQITLEVIPPEPRTFQIYSPIDRSFKFASHLVLDCRRFMQDDDLAGDYPHRVKECSEIGKSETSTAFATKIKHPDFTQKESKVVTYKASPEDPFAKELTGKIKRNKADSSVIIEFDDIETEITIKDPRLLKVSKGVGLNGQWMPVNHHPVDPLEYFTNGVQFQIRSVRDTEE